MHSVLTLAPFFSHPNFSAAEVEPADQQTASFLEQHVAQATWKSFVVECKEDYDLLYREVREKRGISINIIIVDRIQDRPRMYSDERMSVLRDEHGFRGYLDECFKAPKHIAQALVNRHSVDYVLVGGEAVQNSIDRKDLIEFLATREAHDGRPGKQSSCFFYTHQNKAFKYNNTVSRYSGQVGTDVSGEAGCETQITLKPSPSHPPLHLYCCCLL